MSIVVTKGGRGVRGDLASHDLFPGAKRVILRRFQKIVRRDAQNVIREQLEEDRVSAQERKLAKTQEEALRMERLFYDDGCLDGPTDFDDDFDCFDDFYREQEEIDDRYREHEYHEQLRYFMDCDELYIHGIS